MTKNINTSILTEKNALSRRGLMFGGISLCLLAPLALSNKAYADAGFRRWIAQFKKTALDSGISSKTYDSAFQNTYDIDKDVIEKANYQPEFSDPTWNYFDNRIHEAAINNGKRNKQQWKKTLNQIESRFGVDQNILLAIWSMESNYGAVLSRPEILHNVFTALATLAYKDKKRTKFAKNQLIAALKILQNENLKPSQMQSSWAGAMGHTQFIPTSYLTYGVDMDNDGKCDIWHSIPDALATSANLLAKNGWQNKRTFGYEIILPEGRKYPSGSLPIHQWQAMGIQRANGQAFPFPDDKATLKLPDGRDSPIFLVINNFFVLKRYNNADRYAFAVGLLAEQIAGLPKTIKDWNRPFTKTSIDERLELQTRLKKLGFYNGEVDGKIGSASKQAIATFQASKGLNADGYPSKEVLLRLREL